MARSSRKKKGEDREGAGASMERWLLSYADFITLLMVFFIMMYAMSKVDVNKYTAMANSLSIVLTDQAMSMLDAQGPSMAQGVSGQQVIEGQGQAPATQGELNEIKKQIEEFLKVESVQGAAQGKTGAGTATKLGDNIVILEQERGLVISFKDALLFSSGSDELAPGARQLITRVGMALTKIPNYVRVEGHTDNLPIHTARFPSNWELSVLRATNVVHVLQADAGIPPERLSIIGYGEYRPLIENSDALSRAMNRRVDIVILKKKYDYFEPPTMNDE